MSRNRRRHDDHENHEAWAIPYGDLVTLLLAFFVVMYAMSTVNEGKYRVLSDSLSEAFNGTSRGGATIGNGSVVNVEMPRSQVRRMISASLPGMPAPAPAANNVRAEIAAAAA